MRVSSWCLGSLAAVLLGTTALASPLPEEPARDVAAVPKVVAAPAPAEQFRSIVDALIANDIEELFVRSSGQAQEKVAQEWERDRVRAAGREYIAQGDKELDRMWLMLRTPEGTAALADELFPAFAEKANLEVAQLNGGIAMTLSSIASDAKLAPDEVQQLSQLMLAVQRWSNGVDWQDRARFDLALGEIAGFVRRSGVETSTEIQLLPYEDALRIGDEAIATFKRVLRVYGLDAAATLHTVRIDEVSRDGDAATLRWSARVLDVPLAITREMHYDRGYTNRWIDADDYAQQAGWRAEYEAVHPEEAAAADGALEQDACGDQDGCLEE